MIGAIALALAASVGPGPLERCDLPPGWAAVAARQTRFVVFGETHGTRQAPAFVGDLACALAFDGERLLIAIEQQASDDAALQAAWALPDDRFAAALATVGWAGRRDGVASRAMADLLVRLHRLSAGGRTVDVVAFNGARDAAQAARFAALPGQGPHEAEQAQNIRIADGGRYDHVLVLTGSLHARKRPVTRGGVSFEPMAMRLAPAAAVTSLLMVGADGTAWNCLLRPGATVPRGGAVPPEAIECGDHRFHGAPDLRKPPFMALDRVPGAAPASAEATAPDYDGYFWVGPVTGSPPAVPAVPAAAARP